MTAVKAIILGLIQGIAEFLPVSSSGHLALFKNLLGLEQVPLVFDVILHMATLCAVVLVFWKRIAGILKALWLFVSKGKTNVSTGGAGPDEGAQENLAVIPPLLAATAITAVLGYAIQKFFNNKNIVLYIQHFNNSVGTNISFNHTAKKTVAPQIVQSIHI